MCRIIKSKLQRLQVGQSLIDQVNDSIHFWFEQTMTAISDRQISVQCASCGRKPSQILTKERRVWMDNISGTRDEFQLRVRIYGWGHFKVKQSVGFRE